MTLEIINTKTFSLPFGESDPEVLAKLQPFVGFTEVNLRAAYFAAVQNGGDGTEIDTIASILSRNFGIIADFHDFDAKLRVYPCSFTPAAWAR